jgi:hypothetical protein
MHTLQSIGDLRHRMEVGMKYPMPAISVEVLEFAFIEFLFVIAYDTVLWNMFGAE